MKFIKNTIGYENINSSLLKDGIHYKYNNLGHRCKNIQDVDTDNYILFAGCSHTFGEGLFLEQTYPFVTAKLFNSDYYNLGLPASGFDVLFYNVMSWLKHYKKPKLIVLQYPDQTRFNTIMHDHALLKPYGSWMLNNPDIDKLMVVADEIGMFKFRNFMMNKLLNDTIDIPVVKLIFGNSQSYDSECIKIERLDYAIDNQHYGIETHEHCADLIFNKIK